MQNIEMNNWNIEEDEIKRFIYPIFDLELAGYYRIYKESGIFAKNSRDKISF